MARSLAGILCLALLGALLAAPAASAEQTAAQKLFRDKLLEHDSVSRDVKTRLRKGGFVDRNVVFRDLTGEGKADAVVSVHSGGSAGRIALFVFSAGRGDDLKLVYRNQRLYRAQVRVAASSIFYTVPLYETGDELCCPERTRETELVWRTDRSRFVVARRTTMVREGG